MPYSTNNRPRPTLPILLLSVSALLTGCETITSLYSDEEATRPEIAPGDFVQLAQRQATPTDPNAEQQDATAAAADSDSTETTANETPPANPNIATGAVSINAMVGYINSEAVYADQIFDINLIAQLEAFGRRYESDQFKTMANQVIQEKLRGIIINKLILGEAELNLEDPQRQAIDIRVNQEREELLRFYGQGSISKARAEFRKQRGSELDDFLTDFREELIVQIYIQAKVLPKISISQINIENYYEDNKDKYNKPEERVLRLLRAPDAEAAKTITSELAKGVSFEEVASREELNTYRADSGGLLNGGKPALGEVPTSIEPVNKAVLKLKAGQHAGPLVAGDNHYFVELISYTPGVNTPLREVQIEIEQALRALEFERQVLRFRMDLLKRGSYTNPETMGSKLLEIAAARYDQ